MVRVGMLLSVVFAFVVMVGGCGGGDGDGGGEPLYIVGTWIGPMSHHIIDHNQGTDVTVTYTITFYILSQEGSRVTGKLQLRDPSHVGNLHGSMSGSHFKGVRTGLHTVTIEFDVNGNTLTGTFRFVGDGLDEYGEYTCTKL
jgi:hypothetical protein